MSFGVVACTRCKKARVIEDGRRTAECAHCGRRLRLDELRVHHRSADAEEARAAAGALNAHLAGRSSAYATQMAALTAAPAPAPRGSLERVAARVRAAAGGEGARFAAAAAALGEGGAWTLTELEAAAARAGLDPAKAEAHVERLRASGDVVESRWGRYRWA